MKDLKFIVLFVISVLFLGLIGNKMNINLEVAKVFGQPIDSQNPVDINLATIAELGNVEGGEQAYYFDDYDNIVNVLWTANANGEITSTRKVPNVATEISLSGYQTELTYVSLDSLATARDITGLARQKVSISRAMDNFELKSMLDLILAIPSQEIVKTTGQDLYDGIVALVHKVAQYGTNYKLLVSVDIWEAINLYDKSMVTTFEYKLGIFDMLKQFGIEVIKIVGDIQLNSGTGITPDPILAPNTAILVAVNSTISDKLPCLLLRRKFSPEVSKAVGAEGSAERIILTIGDLRVINNDKNILGYGICGYCNVGFAVTNYLAVAYCKNLI